LGVELGCFVLVRLAGERFRAVATGQSSGRDGGKSNSEGYENKSRDWALHGGKFHETKVSDGGCGQVACQKLNFC
jgi:hypothetical protein